MKKMIYLLLFYSTTVFSQTFLKDNSGLTVGAILNFGTHVNTVGLNVKSCFSRDFYQINVGSSINWNLKSYGGRTSFWESRSYLGLVFLGGKRDNTRDFQMDGLMHQTNYRNAIAYNYLWYFDKKGTSQLSGGWSLHANKLAFYFENDVFGGQANDRYRTGHLLVSYRLSSSKFGSGVYLWTGETRGAKWKTDDSLHYQYGYKDLSQLPYGKTSHGILYGQFIGNLGYGQDAHVELGFDSELMRNAIQNKIIHDLKFAPKKIERKTPNYPMLDKNGLPTHVKTEVRESLYYFQVGMNENWSN